MTQLKKIDIPDIPGFSASGIALTTLVTFFYRFNNIDDIIFAVNEVIGTQTKYSYVRYNFPDNLLRFSKLYEDVQESVAQSEKFDSLSDLVSFLESQDVSSSQLNVFNKYSFTVCDKCTTCNGKIPGRDSESEAYEFGFVSCSDSVFLASDSKFLHEQMTQFLGHISKDKDIVVDLVSLLTPSQISILPDPVKDLDFCGYIGAIHEIFEKNVTQFPERHCVVETDSKEHPDGRIFTYSQINESSNVLAHCLQDSGIQIGDIVTIYSSRSVELMICVLAILKSGGTFSVIDPAYPPMRQNVYLGVAKPRGLIVIGKAGTLDDVVEKYIDEELDLKCRIDDVDMQNEGVPKGTFSSKSVGNASIEKFYDVKQDNLGVVVGPDAHPTLAFTSGSEGIPKGVLGRHFSLAYYFPWMSQEFNLSSKDKFTMLSGIAHDPIQRDMFTPLFLGAQLYIPTANDIGTPGRLAKWMQRHEVTITHLTPAMGQVLTAQATDEIPSLKHAFFVGDLLTKKECLRLQNLAQNLRIVNMYGTTETQRAVSYFTVKSRAEDPKFLFSLNDIVPAGKGMKNVQLLVVNKHDKTRLCGVGEVGELFVRAGGLAEGYRGLPEANKEKFLDSWFVEPGHWKDTVKAESCPWAKYWKGPRDRLYRTGDLGRYLFDGNVEVTGRIDDQVKIRGFRIELGEIDTNISKFAPVLENRTIVRKDESGENYLIGFLVLKDPKSGATAVDDNEVSEKVQKSNTKARIEVVKSLATYPELYAELKKFLSTKLAKYAVPQVFVVLDKFPLTPNGKVDKRKLPVPTADELAIASSFRKVSTENLTETEKKVKDIWYDVLPTKPAISSPQDSFFDLGGHSVLATRMIFQVREKLGVDLPLGSIFKDPTLGGFCSQIEAAKSGSQVTNGSAVKKVSEYASDAAELAKSLPKYVSGSIPSENLNVFVTGTTGFLGAFIVRELLSRSSTTSVYAHVRADSEKAGLQRLVDNLKLYGLFKESYLNRLHVVLGDLSKPQFGMDDSAWTQLCSKIGAIVHNGAMVHWVYPYQKMRSANVLATINVMSMGETGIPKAFVFISSTSVLDVDHYFNMEKVLESDDLQGSKNGLGTGYGQSKWAAEYLVRKAAENGLNATIVRPGYVTGYSKNGVANVDDFLLRMLKGCIELGSLPKDVTNRTNAVPVDHVARVVVSTALSALNSTATSVKVAQVTAHPRIEFNAYLDAVNKYGYSVKPVDYETWKKELSEHIATKESALFPLLHMVLGDLKKDTMAPELDDTYTQKCLGPDGEKWIMGVDENVVGTYLGFLTQIGFLPEPATPGLIPKVELESETLTKFRSGAGIRSSAN